MTKGSEVYVSIARYRTKFNVNRSNTSIDVSAPLPLWHWPNGHFFVFCDVCGSHEAATLGKNSVECLSNDAVWETPKGWLALGLNMHLCPHCASMFKSALPEDLQDFARPNATEKNALEPDDAASDKPLVTLDAAAAAQLLPDADGIVTVPEGVQAIGPKAFMYREDIVGVILPNSVVRLDEYAFACSSIRHFDAPPALRTIGNKAFFLCENLTEAVLNDGLERIDEDVFARGGIVSLHIPASVRVIGRSITESTPLVYGGDNPGFTIDEASSSFMLDAAGNLYRKTPRGFVFLLALDTQRESYDIDPATVYIAPLAFHMSKNLTHIVIPEGVEGIGRSAFESCKSLAEVSLPESLRSIEEQAFADTAIETLHIPANVEYIGPCAFATKLVTRESNVQRITIDPANPQFFMRDTMMLQHLPDGESLIWMPPKARRVTIPDDICSIGQCALTTIEENCEVHIGKDLTSIHPHAFAPSPKATFTVELAEEVCGRREAVIPNPSSQTMVLSTLDAAIDCSVIFAMRDDEAVREYALRGHATYAIGRLECPQFLPESIRADFRDSLQKSAGKIMLDFALRGDTDHIRRMADLGVLSIDSVTFVIDKLADSGRTAAIGCLLDIKQKLFGSARTDFSL